MLGRRAAITAPRRRLARTTASSAASPRRRTSSTMESRPSSSRTPPGRDVESRHQCQPRPRKLGNGATRAATETSVDELLSSLGSELGSESQVCELVAIGAFGLASGGFLSRPTHDLDILAVLDNGVLVCPDPCRPSWLPRRSACCTSSVSQTSSSTSACPGTCWQAAFRPVSTPTRTSPLRRRSRRPRRQPFRSDPLQVPRDGRERRRSRQAQRGPRRARADRRGTRDRRDVGEGGSARASAPVADLLAEQLLRSGVRDQALVGVVAISLTRPSRRKRLAVWMLGRPPL